MQSDSGLHHSTSIQSGLQSGLLRASSGITESMKSAVERTTSIKTAISKQTSASTKDFLAALQSTANGDLEEASVQV